MEMTFFTCRIFQVVKQTLPVFCVILLMATAGCVVFPHEGYPGYFISHYYYQLTISPTAPVYNATFLIPFPVNNSPLVGDEVVNSSRLMNNYRLNKYREYDASRVPEISVALDSTTGNVTFIKIFADYLPPHAQYEFYVENHIDRPRFTYYAVQTKDPLGNESVFLPKLNMIKKVPVPESKISYGMVLHESTVISYDTRIYADYSTGPGTVVDIDTQYEVSNIWLQRHELALSNRYKDRISTEFVGEQHGWHTLEGTLQMGAGHFIDNATQQFV